ncbi:alpha/beta fold hydrolase [Acinetobacter sp. S40]|uniref:alpha/beta fold hydrolase n=1 Tax=unclassified Acinetobacter TaxID=196816 RepID=UPI00190CB0F9|nr:MULTISPECIES: alpha/beta fold hydrolase [unclassified Acinetobacter]MBJ9985328.1 alpha/beta fold hydrolase [Acinetobacter sp. S40]MBK0063890.1 alpha/beta fold hydrolase [Acinetobacter sp. S55]MBK0067042.1 alpha/beta fold hydrolase [Acinetobacter sp. S54]
MNSVKHVIFLPGASGSTSFWFPLIEKLPQDITLQMMAYPAFANEPAHPDIHNFDQLQQYILEKIDRPSVLIAQSMGGIFAVAAALQKTELIQGLVLIATSGGIDLSKFKVADWRQHYAKEFLDYPDWFITTNINYEDQLAQIQQKTLLIWGDQDLISPVDVGQYLEQSFKDAKLKIIQGGEHDLAHHYAEQVAKEIMLYLYQIDKNILT